MDGAEKIVVKDFNVGNNVVCCGGRGPLACAIQGATESPSLSDDAFLGGVLRVFQPVDGYRAGMDAVLLGACVDVGVGLFLDVGCGVGVAGLCLMQRCFDCRVVGFDVLPFFVHLAMRNAHRNGLGDRFTAMVGDVRNYVPPQLYDHVITNPPFFVRQTPNSGFLRRIGRHTDIVLEQWLRFCLDFVRPGGYVFAIANTKPIVGVDVDMDVMPIVTHPQRPPKRWVMRIKVGDGRVSFFRPWVAGGVHDFTPLLRTGGPLTWDPL